MSWDASLPLRMTAQNLFEPRSRGGSAHRVTIEKV